MSMRTYVKSNGKVKLECTNKDVFDNCGLSLVDEVTRTHQEYVDAMNYTREEHEKHPDRIFSILLYPRLLYQKRSLEVRIDFREGKHSLSLCELTSECDYRFHGRLVIKGYPCWDHKSELKALYKRLHLNPKQIKPPPKTKKPLPTLEDMLPPHLAERISTRKFKEAIEKGFPPTSVAYRVIIPERDEMTRIEYASKIETWWRVIKISLEANR